MKNLFNFRLAAWLTCFLFMLAVASCEKTEADTDAIPPTEVLDKNLLKSASEYKTALENRENNKSTPFTILDIKREGAILKVKVKGGCVEDSYKVIWNGVIMESFPMQVGLVLTYEPKEIECQAIKEFTLAINLSKIVGEQANLDHYVFHIANGSVKQDKSLNPDGTVSSR